MKKIIILLLVFVAVSGCSKNKSVGNKIVGTWLEISTNGNIVVPEFANKIIFTGCKHNQSCLCSIMDGSSGEISEYKYKIDEQGTQLLLIETFGMLQLTTAKKIVNVNNKSLTIDWGTYTTEYKRQ